jgi:hypothetical protein
MLSVYVGFGTPILVLLYLKWFKQPRDFTNPYYVATYTVFALALQWEILSMLRNVDILNKVESLTQQTSPDSCLIKSQIIALNESSDYLRNVTWRRAFIGSTLLLLVASMLRWNLSREQTIALFAVQFLIIHGIQSVSDFHVHRPTSNVVSQVLRENMVTLGCRSWLMTNDVN